MRLRALRLIVTLALGIFPEQLAAAAGAGWYLMEPPPRSDAEPDEQAPLSRWQMLRSFDTAGECEKDRVSRLAAVSAEGWWRDEMVTNMRRFILRAQCIASDDPRLVPKR